MIRSISVVTQQKTYSYTVGGEHPAGTIAEIKIHPIYFSGDPFDHYCGFDENAKLLFSLEQSVPCDVEYI